MSSVKSPTSPRYHTSIEQKIISRNAAKQFKISSPKLQDMLRQRCRARVREARQAKFDSTRNTSRAFENCLVSNVLRQELCDLESDLDLQEQIFQELIDEINFWFAKQLEEEEQYLIEVGDTNVVFCPVCQKKELKQFNQQLNCECGICFDFSGQLEKLQSTLQDVINHHGMECNQILNFFVEKDSIENLKTLNAMCVHCEYFTSMT